MKKLGNIFKNHDWPITLIALSLILIGTIGIYGVTFNSITLEQGQGIIYKHLVLIIVGLIVYSALTLIDFRWLKESNVLWILFSVIIGLLIYVKFFTPEIAGTNRWITIGSFSIQPAEYAKIALIMITSSILANENQNTGKYKITMKRKFGLFSNYLQEHLPILFEIIKSFLIISPILFLILIEPALGNTIITFLIWLSIVIFFFPDKTKLFLIGLSVSIGFLLGINIINSFNLWIIPKLVISGAGIFWLITTLNKRIHELAIFFIIGLLIFPISFWGWNNVLKDYQKTRIETFINPQSDPQGSGWQVIQSQIAIGSGRIFGKGFMEGTQSGLKILPYAHTDFIFASIAEQFGFVGAIATITLLLSLVLRIFYKGLELTDTFAQYSTIGIASMILIQIIINIGMNLGKLPVTGITLPLISYGGSSILVTLISLGLVQNFISSEED
jgi:rod shape determining protein RodA